MIPSTEEFEKLTFLDRSVQILLKGPTASARHGISASTERLHSLHGTSLIYDASQLLSLGASTFATACTVFHRFYHQCSLHEYDVWSVAVASTLLATKLEEEPRAIKALIRAYSHLYRKRLLLVSSASFTENDKIKQHPFCSSLQTCTSWTREEKDRRLSQIPLPSGIGPVYNAWHDQISKMEAVLLRQLGFTLHWVPDSHPHKFILYFCGVLELTEVEFVQRSWEYCNDSCRLDLCIRFSAEVIASGSILLAARDLKIHLPIDPQPWWEIFIGSKRSDELATVANCILGLKEMEEENISNADAMLASIGFVRSLMEEKSFNDYESFLWDYQKKVIDEDTNQ